MYSLIVNPQHTSVRVIIVTWSVCQSVTVICSGATLSISPQYNHEHNLCYTLECLIVPKFQMNALYGFIATLYNDMAPNVSHVNDCEIY